MKTFGLGLLGVTLVALGGVTHGGIGADASHAARPVGAPAAVAAPARTHASPAAAPSA